MPYSNRGLRDYVAREAWDPVYDLWSLGIVIFEVLVGPEIVKSLDSDQKVRDALNMVKPHLDADLHYLVERMTVFVDPKPVALFLANPNLISEVKV